MRRFFYLSLSLLWLCAALIQEAVASGPVDSLKKVAWRTDLADTAAFQTYRALAKAFPETELDSGVYYYQKAIAIAGERKDTTMLIDVYGDLGNYYQKYSQFIPSLDYLRRSYFLMKEVGRGADAGSSYLLISIGNIYYGEEVWSIARNYYRRAGQQFAALADTSGLILTYRNLGMSFTAEDLCDSMLYYAHRAWKLEQRLPGRAAEKVVLGSLMNQSYKCDKQGAKEREWTQRALRYAEKAGGVEKVAGLWFSSLYNNAMAYIRSDSAAYYLEQFENQLKQYPQFAPYLRGNLLALKKNYEAVRENYRAAIPYIQEIIRDSLLRGVRLRRQYQHLGSMYEQIGDYAKALDYFKIYQKQVLSHRKDKFADKVVKMYAAMENYEQRRLLEAKELALQREQALKEQEAESRRFYALAFGIVLLLLLGMGWMYRGLRRSKRVLQKQHEIIEVNARELNDLNQTKDKLMSILAHDLRGPFGNMLQLSEWLSRDLKQQPMASRSQELAAGLARTAKSSYLLFEDLLSWSKSQAGALRLNRQAVVLPKLAAEVLALFQSQLYEKNIEVKQDWQAPGLDADPEMLRTILRNLIGNTLQYSSLGGELRIGSRTKGEDVELWVEDTAGGIPESMLPKLFSEEKWKQRKGNSGLGLILCKQFMEKHEGQIEVKSELGEGTRFDLFFPKAQTRVERIQTEEQKQKGRELPSEQLLQQFLPIWEALAGLKITEATRVLRLSQELLREKPGLESYIKLWREAVFQQQDELLEGLKAELRMELQQRRGGRSK